MRAVGYIRVSQVGDRKTDSSSYRTEQEQELSIRAAAREIGADVVDVIRERNVSGGSMSPGRALALEMIETGAADVLIVAHSDRLARNVELDQQIRRRIKTAGGQLVSVAEAYDDSTAAGRMFSQVMASFSEMYRETRREGFARAQAAAVAAGVHVAGTPPGYRRSNGKRSPLVPDPKTAHLIPAAFKMRASGASLAVIRKMLADGGIVLKHDSDVHNLLKRRTYLGEASGASAGWVADAHPPLVTEELFGAAQIGRVRFQTNGRLTKAAKLAGLVHCGTCGHRLRLGAGGKQGQARYICKGHGCSAPASCYAHLLDEHVGMQLTREMFSRDERTLTLVTNASRHEAAVRQLIEARAERSAYVLAMPASDPDFASGLAARDEAIRAAETLRDELSPYRAAGKTREQLTIDRVTLNPGRAPVAERCSIEWR